MITLGIETSCDETSVALLRGKNEILSHLVFSQMEHAGFGGVVPELASRAHLVTLLPMIEKSLEEAAITQKDIDLIGVTCGPGLIGALLVGLCTAKSLALSLDIPLIGVNHVEAHILANLLVDPIPETPLVALLVSGGHTMLVRVKDWGEYESMGSTRDDAVGESFDKVAKMLDLGYPGGPLIEKSATGGNAARFRFPRPMIKDPSLDLSFSGLKTAVLNEVMPLCESGSLDRQTVCDIAASFQEAVVDVLVSKTLRACRKAGARTLIIAGGVARNRRLRDKLTVALANDGIAAVFPPLSLCADNGAMVACVANFYHQRGFSDDLSLNAFPTGSMNWPE